MKKSNELKSTDKSYVAEAFDFEKIATIYMVKIFLPYYNFRDLTFIKMGPKTQFGDIDVSLLYNPNYSLYIQIKSNQNMREIKTNDIMEGFDQLFKFKTSHISDGVKQSKYLLVYEGYTEDNNIKLLNMEPKHKSQTVTFWINFLNKKLNQNGDYNLEREICSFIDSAHIILLPSRFDMRIVLEFIFLNEDLRYLIGNLTYDKKIDNSQILNLISCSKFKPMKSEKDIYEKYAKEIKKIITDKNSLIVSSKIIEFSFVILGIPLDLNVFKGIIPPNAKSNIISEELKKNIQLSGDKYIIKRGRGIHIISPTPDQDLQKVDGLEHYKYFDFIIHDDGPIVFLVYPFIFNNFNRKDHPRQFIRLFPRNELKMILTIILNVIKVMMYNFTQNDSFDGFFVYLEGNNYRNSQLENKLFDEDIPIEIQRLYEKNNLEKIDFNYEIEHILSDIEISYCKSLDDSQYFEDNSDLLR